MPGREKPLGPPVAVGQARSDGKGGGILIRAQVPSLRYLVEYPRLRGEQALLGELTIRQEYPEITTPGAIGSIARGDAV